MPRTTDDPAVKKSVSFPRSLLRAGVLRARSLGWNLSQYCQHLMREDLIRRGEITRAAETPEIFHHAPTPDERADVSYSATKKKTAAPSAKPARSKKRPTAPR